MHGPLDVAVAPLDRLTHVDDRDVAPLVEPLGEIPHGDLRHRLHGQALTLPLDHPALDHADHLIDAHAGERAQRPIDVGRRVREQDQRRAVGGEPADAIAELRALDPDVERARHVAFAVRRGLAQIEDAGAAGPDGVPRLARGEGPWLGQLEGERAEVLADDRLERRRLRGKPGHQEIDELGLAPGAQRGIEAPLEPDGRCRLRGHRPAAQRAGAVGGIDLDGVVEAQE